MPYIIIVFSVKMAYFFDTATIPHLPHPTLQSIRSFVTGNKKLGYGLSLVGFAALEAIEVYVARTWLINRTVGFFLSQALTLALLVSNQINTGLNAEDAASTTQVALINFDHGRSEALTWGIFLATPLFLAITVGLY